MKLNKDKLTPLHGYLEGDALSVDKESSDKAINYKKTVTRNYISISQDQLDFRLAGTEFYVTRKYDGELNLIFYDGTDTCIINRSGRVRLGLPAAEEAGKALAKAGIKQAIIPSELYVCEDNGRTRIFDVLEYLADETKLDKLYLAPFDIFELEDKPFNANSYGETIEQLNKIFSGGDKCRPVICQKAESKSEVKDIYQKWVEEDMSEGLVVRSELPIIFKVKPRYTVDVAVVGFSEGTGDQKGQVRSLLLAMMPEDGQYQIIGKTGNGFSDELKKELLGKLTPKKIESLYIETDSNHVAFHMIEPELVIELIVNDVIFETSSGAVQNPILEIVNGQYIRRGSVNGISFVYPIFDRFRDDKKCVFDDVRLAQINEFAYIPQEEIGEKKELAKSEIVHRVVYKKETAAKLMVQKFIVWKTGKESDPSYPAYVFHYTNFSSDRKDPLQREMSISDNHEQIMELMQASIDKNVKKGWEEV